MAGWFDENAHPAWFIDPSRGETPDQMPGQPGVGPAPPFDYGDDTRGTEDAYLMPGDGRTGGDFGGPRQDFRPTSPDFSGGGGFAGGINPPGRPAPSGDMNTPPNFSGWIGQERGMSPQVPPGGMGGSPPPMQQPAPPMRQRPMPPPGQGWQGMTGAMGMGGGGQMPPGQPGAPLGMVGNPNNWMGGQGARPMGLAQHLMNGGQSVTMRGPTGQVVQVPNTVVQHFMAQGATVVR